MGISASRSSTRPGSARRSGSLVTADDADRLALASGELSRIAPPALARAEAAWLEGRSDEIVQLTEPALQR